MHFDSSQLLAVIAPLVVALVVLLAWYIQDKKHDQESDQERLWVLMLIFGISAVWGFVLRSVLIFLGDIEVFRTMLQGSVFGVLVIFREEFIKATSLIFGLEIAGKRFNEVSDGVLYAVMAALGFVFVENIFYLFATQGGLEFMQVLVGRFLVPLSIHFLTTIIFGLSYAVAYLGYKKYVKLYVDKFDVKETFLLAKPYALWIHLKLVLFTGNFFYNLVKMLFCWDLFKRIYLSFWRLDERTPLDPPS